MISRHGLGLVIHIMCFILSGSSEICTNAPRSLSCGGEILGKDECPGMARFGAIQSFLCSESIQPLRLYFFLESFLSFSFGYSI
jgi:hypothetical protein